MRPPRRDQRRLADGPNLAGATIQSLEPRRLLAARLLADVQPAPSRGADISPLVPFGGEAYFVVHGTDPRANPQPGVWRTDLAGHGAGAELVAPGAFTDLTVSGGALWTSGRTAGAASSNVYRLGPGGAPEALTFQGRAVEPTAAPAFAPLGGLTVFHAWVAPSSGSTASPEYHLLAAGGTPLQTYDLGTAAGGYAGPFVAAGPYLYSTDYAGTLFRTDGTAGGTVRLAPGDAGRVEFDTGPSGRRMAGLPDGSLVYFGYGPDGGVRGLWRTDGTPSHAATLLKVAAAPDGLGEWFDAMYLTPLGRRVYFNGGDRYDRELWATDGTPAGTGRVKDIRPGTGGSSPSDLTTFGGALYFTAGLPEPAALMPPQLWRSDGTDVGTVSLTNIGRPGSTPFGGAFDILGGVDGTLFFCATDGPHGTELYQTDGTPAGTGRTGDLWPGPASAYPGAGVEAAGRFVFTATDSDHGRELWVAEPHDRPVPVGTGSISGTVFDDVNHNGRQDGEPYLGDQLVFLDLDFDRAPDPGEPSARTDSEGRYTFADLPAGRYQVVYAPGPDRWAGSGGYGAWSVDLGSEEHLTGYAFFSVPGTFLRGSVFNDADLDGVRGAGEPPLAGWTVFLDHDHNGRLDPGETRATTDAGGNYEFAHLGAPATGRADFRVRAAPHAGTYFTAPASGFRDATPARGEPVEGLDIGAAVVAPVAGFTLVNADSDEAVPNFTLEDGATIDLAQVGHRLNVRADLGPGPARSVRFNLDGDPDFRVERGAPYALAGDDNGNFARWTPALGTHTLIATAYRGDRGTGERSEGKAITFTVIDTGQVPAPVRVNAGGGAYKDSAGHAFAADAGFRGGRTQRIPVPIAGTTDDALYQSFRTGRSFDFSRAAPDGAYALTLHFAEPTEPRAGKRVFDVFAEGRLVLNDFDILRRVGRRAATTATVPVTVNDGRLDVQFRGVRGDAIVSAVELTPAPRVPAVPGPAYVNAGGGRFADSVGRVFEADNGFTGGTRSQGGFGLPEGTPDGTLFTSYRAGRHFTFRRPVANGHYALWLEFAEPAADAPRGARTFDVSAEGRPVLDDYDVVADAGAPHKPVARSFDVTVADGALDLSFDGVAGGAIVSAVVLVPTDVPAEAAPYTLGYYPGPQDDAYAVALQVYSESNVRQILYAMELYANEHHGSPPPDLVSVLPDLFGAGDVHIFADPRAATLVPRGELSWVERAAWVAALRDYVYVGPPSDQRARPRWWPEGTEPVVYENPSRVAGPLAVGFSDGHVELIDRAAAAALLNGGVPLPDPAEAPALPHRPSRPADPRVWQSQQNLYALSDAMGIFANENSGRFPRDFGILPVAYNVPLSTFVNPRVPGAATPPAGLDDARAAAWAVASSDYVFLTPGRTAWGPSVVVAYENPAEMRDGINLLFDDGHVEFREMRWALETIAHARAAQAAYPF